VPGGLNPVVQPVGADTSKYIAEYRQALAITKELNAANQELLGTVAQAQSALGRAGAGTGTAGADSIRAVNAAIREQLADLGRAQDMARGYMSAANDAARASAAFGNASAATAGQIRAHAGTVEELAQAYSKMSVTQFEALDQAKMGWNEVQAAIRAVPAVYGDVRKSADGVTASLGEQARATDNAGGSVLSYARNIGLLEDRARAATSALNDAAAAAARARAAGTGSASASILGPALAAAMGPGAGGGGGTTDTAAAAVIARNLASRGYGPTPGSTSAVDTALAALLGGAGGGGGGSGGGGGGGFLGAFADAFRPSTIFGGALGTVKMAHMIAMFTMETLSTVIPAGVAMAAAGATGLQGGTNVYTSGSSLYNATEALGGAYGKTFGSYLGLGSSFQAAQNMANGGVYGIAGGVLNLAGQGRDAFSSMGVQTVAMIDRGIASMVLNNRMSQVGQALAGGTQDLRAFGDIGANIGDTLLNMAPSLPGLGPDLLGTLKGATGALASTTGFLGKTGILAPLLAGEAGYRWGDLALAGGKMPWFLGGGQVKGLSGLASRMGLGELPMTTDEAVAAGLGTAGEIGTGGIAGTGLAGLLAGGAAGLPIGALTAIAALSAYGISRGSFGTLASRQMSGYMGPINQSFGANAWQPISSALYQASAVQQNLPGLKTETVAGQQVTVGQPIAELMREGYSPSQAAAKYASEFAGNTKTLADMQANLIEAGPQAVKALQDMGIKGASVAQALQVMTEAMVTPGMIGTGGKLSPTAVQLMKQFETTYSPMTGTGPGAVLAAASAQDIMSNSAMKSLATVNSAMDSVSQIIMGGASGAAAGTAARTGLPQGFGQALGQGPFTAAGAGAWTQFTTGTSTQPGVISSLQSNMDQLRTYMTLGALSSGQAAGLGAYEVGQDLTPVQRSGSPMALAMLMQQGVQAGIPGLGYYNPKMSFAQNLASIQKAVRAASPGRAGATGLLTQGTIATANLPALAASLITSQTGASALDTAEVTQAGTQALAIQQAVAGGKPLGGNLSGLVATLMAGQGTKYQPGAMQASLKSILGQEGIGGSALSHLVQQGTVMYKAEYDKTNPPKVTGTVDFKPVTEHFTPPPVPKGGTIDYASRAHPPAVPPAPRGGTVQYSSHVQTPVAPPAPHGGTVVYSSVVLPPAGPAGGLGARFLVGHAAGFRVPGFGGGDRHLALLEGGETVLPKEATPDPMTAALGSKYRIPGFQSGGIVDPSVPYFASMGVSIRSAFQDVTAALVDDMEQIAQQVSGATRGGGSSGSLYGGGPQPMAAGPVPHGTLANPVAVHVASVAPAVAASGGGGFPGAPGPMPAAANKVIDAFEKTFASMPGPWSQVASQILNGLLAGVKNSTKETAAMAQALVSKVQTEIAFGRGVTNTAVAGLNFPGMQVATPTTTSMGTPYQYYTDQQNIAAGGQPGSVQEQMGSYLQAMQSFQGDMSKLAKGGLEKRLMSQLYAAGPVQGDAEAQSILGGAGGIKAANQLYNQINSLATKLGVSAIGNVYGMPAPAHPAAALAGKSVKVGVHADTAAAQASINAIHGKSVTVTVNLNMTGGGGGSGGGLNLSPAEIKSIASQVQSKLLQQAKNNRRTGTTLPGYGS
jgi:hypothetical protein